MASEPAPPAAAPKTADEWKQLGNKAFGAGTPAGFTEAIGHYTEAHKLEPTNHVHLSNRSAAYLARNGPGDALAALSDANAAIRACPSFAKAYGRKAAALMSLKQVDEAVVALQAGLRADPSNAALRESLTAAQATLAASRAAEAEGAAAVGAASSAAAAGAASGSSSSAPASAASVPATAAAGAASDEDPLAAFLGEVAELTEKAAVAGHKRPRPPPDAFAGGSAEEEDTYEARELELLRQQRRAAGISSDDEDSDAETTRTTGAASVGGSSAASSASGLSGGSGAIIAVGGVVTVMDSCKDPAAIPTFETDPQKAAREALSAQLAAADLGKGPQQIDRLVRHPHAKWLNLNPYEVLQLPHNATVEDINTRYRRLSALVHPDKNAADEQARDAFEAVKAAAEALGDVSRRKVYGAIMSSAIKLAKRARREAVKAAGPGGEASVEPLAEFISRESRKAFAEREQRKRSYEARIKAETKKEVEEELRAEEEAAAERAADAEWAKGRDRRAEAWAAYKESEAKRRKIGEGGSGSGGGGLVLNAAARFGTRGAADKPGAGAASGSGGDAATDYRKTWR